MLKSRSVQYTKIASSGLASSEGIVVVSGFELWPESPVWSPEKEISAGSHDC